MPHLIYLAVGFPPAAKSSAYRLRATANVFCELGWDVTVVTIAREAWLLEYGLDPSLEESVHPKVRVIELPLARADLDPDIRHYGWLRARHPIRWRKLRRRLDEIPFPEATFGPWRGAIERGAAAVHAERPADLVLASPAPYTVLAGAWHLHRLGVPYAVDFRDAWSLDVLTGNVSAAPGSRIGKWEDRIVTNAQRVWTVNEPIADYYRQRYPAVAERVRVVRNGFDGAEMAPASHPGASDASRSLTFGYLGTVNLSLAHLRLLLDAWVQARQDDPAVARSRLVFRGHIGAGMLKGANSNARTIQQFAEHGVSYGGPVSRADLAATYAGFDALLLALAGGRYVTSGKVYEYLATALPIVSAHEAEHGAAEVLGGYPLWAPAASMSVPDVAAAYVQAARLALDRSPEQSAAAAAYAAAYERSNVLRPAIEELAASVLGVREGAGAR